MTETVPKLSSVIRVVREQPDADDLLFVGQELSAKHLVDGYRAGIFPMELDLEGKELLGWFSPAVRGVFRLKEIGEFPRSELRLHRSLRKVLVNFEARVDCAFSSVVGYCATLRQQGNWISPAYFGHYMDLFDMGIAHSVEAYIGGELVGGLFGVAIGGLFSGESMFHIAPNASKVAFVGLVLILEGLGFELIDGQWPTPHLETLGFVRLDRLSYLSDLGRLTSCTNKVFPPGMRIEKGLWNEAMEEYRRHPEPPIRRL